MVWRYSELLPFHKIGVNSRNASEKTHFTDGRRRTDEMKDARATTYISSADRQAELKHGMGIFMWMLPSHKVCVMCFIERRGTPRDVKRSAGVIEQRTWKSGDNRISFQWLFQKGEKSFFLC